MDNFTYYESYNIPLLSIVLIIVVVVVVVVVIIIIIKYRIFGLLVDRNDRCIQLPLQGSTFVYFVVNL
jgi:membrane protein YdbS with pleckstrin-like domain